MGIFKKYFMDKNGQSLRIKIGAFYFVIALLVSFLTIFSYQKLHNSVTERAIGKESLLSLNSIETAILSLINKADNYSKVLISEDIIQEQLRSGNIYSDLLRQKQIGKEVMHLIQFDKDINSVYLIDQSNHIFSMGNIESGGVKIDDFGEVDWYENVINHAGKYILINQQESLGIQHFNTQYISLIRRVNDLDDFHSIGIISINIDQSAFQNLYAESIDTSTEEMILMDEKNSIIYQEGLLLLDDKGLQNQLDMLNQTSEEGFWKTVNIEGRKYLISGKEMKHTGWKMLRVVLADEGADIGQLYMLAITFLVMNAFLLFICTLMLSQMIITPINELLKRMKSIDHGDFSEITKNTKIKEFRSLFHGYNKMIHQIQKLLNQTVEEQRLIRKVELNNIQAQIKPHFLYNTLDTINALAMTGQNDKVCEIIEALGIFYRKSVSKGRDILTIKDELEIVREYIKILKIRFDNLFEEEFVVDSDTLNYLIPKLTIQPLVENAINHGLRAKGNSGVLRIEVGFIEEYLTIKVADNGVGIKAEILEVIKQDGVEYKEKSMGLRGTLDRIKLIYGDDSRFEINVKLNEYTEINIYILKRALEKV